MSSPGPAFQSADLPAGAVSLDKNPYDLRPAAEAIMDAIENRRRDRRPLVVLMGEQHSASSHTALRQIVMTRLLKITSLASNFIYGLEAPHNNLEKIMVDAFAIVIPKERHGQVAAMDKDGFRFIAGRLAKMVGSSAPFTKANLLSFCLHNGVITRLHDAAKKQTQIGVCLDFDDEKTAQIMKKIGRKKIKMISDQGVALRNQFMVQQVIESMKETNAGICIQHCGLGHVFGDKNEHLFKNSLVSQFERAGVNVLPVFINIAGSNQETIPAEAKDWLDRSVIIDGIANNLFGENSPPGTEQSFIDEINRHSGMELDLVPYSKADLADRFKTTMDAEGYRPRPVYIRTDRKKAQDFTL